MKGAGKFILSIGTFSALAVLYVHLNVALFSVSYQINKGNEQLTQKSEYYRHLKFEVDKLKAPHRLAELIETHKLNLDLPSEVRVIQVPHVNPLDLNAMSNESFEPVSKGILGFLGRWVQVAQAKTDS